MADWQQIATWGLGVLAAAYLVWRQVRPGREAGCGHCPANPEAKPEELIQLDPPPKR